MIENENRIAIIGAGFISDYHIRGLQDAGAEVVAIASRTLANAQAKAEQFRIPEAVSDYRALLQRPDIGAVVITKALDPGIVAKPPPPTGTVP